MSDRPPSTGLGNSTSGEGGLRGTASVRTRRPKDPITESLVLTTTWKKLLLGLPIAGNTSQVVEDIGLMTLITKTTGDTAIPTMTGDTTKTQGPTGERTPTMTGVTTTTQDPTGERTPTMTIQGEGILRNRDTTRTTTPGNQDTTVVLMTTHQSGTTKVVAAEATSANTATQGMGGAVKRTATHSIVSHYVPYFFSCPSQQRLSISFPNFALDNNCSFNLLFLQIDRIKYM